MMPDRVLCKFMFLGVMLLFLAACSNSGSSVAPIATVTTNAPAAPDPALIPGDTIITLTYNASMNTTSLVLGGDLASESNGGVWSTTNMPDDTLTISPTSTWALRTGRHLTIDVKDMDGRSARTLNLTYDIYQGMLYYVSFVTGYDSNPGTSPNLPFKNIYYAMNNASPSATILVAGGTYPVAYGTPDKRLWLRQDIAMYGGYKADFSVRIPARYESVIQDQSVYPATSTNPNFAIIADNNYSLAGTITNTTLVDGFTISGTLDLTTADYTAAIRVRNGAAPAFANNTISGGYGALSSVGIYIEGSASSIAPLIYNNTITGRNPVSATSNSSFGIYVLDVSPVINNNLINGGASTLNTTAFYQFGGASKLRNNILYGGSGTTSSTAISLVSYGTPTDPNIDNNIMFSRIGLGSSCIVESLPSGTGTGDATPASLLNNDMYNCNTLYVDNQLGCNGTSICTTVAQVNALTDIPRVGANISVDPLFADLTGPDNDINTMADNDWHFTPSTLTNPGSPVSVTAGGLNGIDEGWSFITDKDNVVRPASGKPWSIGAYEP